MINITLMNEQIIDESYCVVATDKDRGKRAAISGPMSFEKATQLSKEKSFVQHYIYPKVSKYPYKAKAHGGGKL